MGKSNKFRKDFDYDDYYEESKSRRKQREMQDRRTRKRMKNAMRQHDVEALEEFEDEGF